jgi:ubiquinol-cytochrome c reductase cytochrome b subunit
VMLVLYIIAFIGLGILGTLPSTTSRTIIAQILSVIYFGFFLGMPFYTKNEKPCAPIPDRVTFSTGKQQMMFVVYVLAALVGAYLFATFV